MAEHSERQWTSRPLREVLVYVPPELTPAQRTHQVRTFSRELADRYCVDHFPCAIAHIKLPFVIQILRVQ